MGIGGTELLSFTCTLGLLRVSFQLDQKKEKKKKEATQNWFLSATFHSGLYISK